jgi:hypothetical protein
MDQDTLFFGNLCKGKFHPWWTLIIRMQKLQDKNHMTLQLMKWIFVINYHQHLHLYIFKLRVWPIWLMYWLFSS